MASDMNTVENGLLQPIEVKHTEEGKVLRLFYDLAQYEPNEIMVRVVDHRLMVHAKHEERSENRNIYREYSREFYLPDGTDVDLIRSCFSKDGVLTIECPLPTLQQIGPTRSVPIERL